MIGRVSRAFALLLLFCGSGAAQDNPRIRSLEQKVAVIEDYVKNRFQELQREIERQDAELSRLREEKTALEKQLAELKERLQTTESRLLESKIADQTRALESPRQEEKSAASSETVEPTQYRDPDVARCVASLLSPDRSIRLGALLELGRSESEESPRAIAIALADNDPHIQMLACKLAARKKIAEALPTLGKLLRSPNTEVCKAAGEALSEITGIRSPVKRPGDPGWEESVTRWQKAIERTTPGDSN